MNLIHSFWLAAVSVAVTMATFPVGLRAADVFRHGVYQRVADLLRGRLVHEEFAGVRLAVGVPGQQVDAFLTGGFHGGGEDIGVVGRDADGVRAFQRPRLDQRSRRLGLAVSRAVINQIDVAQFFGRLFRAPRRRT